MPMNRHIPAFGLTALIHQFALSEDERGRYHGGEQHCPRQVNAGAGEGEYA